MGFYNVDMYVAKEENGRHVFYVRPFSEEIRKDLDRLVTDCRKADKNMMISQMNGTYAISTTALSQGTSFSESFWGILFRRFMAESRHVCVDPITEERYYAVIFSNEFINPCERKIAA